jgi:hypothetical protein
MPFPIQDGRAETAQSRIELPSWISDAILKRRPSDQSGVNTNAKSDEVIAAQIMPMGIDIFEGEHETAKMPLSGLRLSALSDHFCRKNTSRFLLEL